MKNKKMHEKKKGPGHYLGGINSPEICFDFSLKSDRLQLRLNSDYKGGKDETKHSR
jgi:hypothetical protein